MPACEQECNITRDMGKECGNISEKEKECGNISEKEKECGNSTEVPKPDWDPELVLLLLHFVQMHNDEQIEDPNVEILHLGTMEYVVKNYSNCNDENVTQERRDKVDNLLTLMKRRYATEGLVDFLNDKELAGLLF